MVMDHGRVIADDTAARLKAELAGDALSFGFDTDDEAERAIVVLGGLTGGEPQREGATTISVTAPDGERLLPTAIRELDAAGAVVRRATGVPPTLDDVFLALTGRTLRESGDDEVEQTEAASTTTMTGVA